MRLLVIAIAVLSGVSPLWSQTITNKNWGLYDQEGVLTYTFCATEDSLFAVLDTTIVLTSFSISCDSLINVSDIDTVECAGIGSYFFEITADTLAFILNEDVCNNRLNLFTSYTWIELPALNLKSLDVPKDSTNKSVPYPNPTTGITYIDLPFAGASTLYVYNSIGKFVFQQTLTEGVNIIDLESYPSGLYLISIHSLNDRTVQELILNN